MSSFDLSILLLFGTSLKKKKRNKLASANVGNPFRGLGLGLLFATAVQWSHLSPQEVWPGRWVRLLQWGGWDSSQSLPSMKVFTNSVVLHAPASAFSHLEWVWGVF